MTLHLVSVRRADNKTYNMYRMPGSMAVALYEVVESEPGRSDQTLCRCVTYDAAVAIVAAMNNQGSKTSE